MTGKKNETEYCFKDARIMIFTLKSIEGEW